MKNETNSDPKFKSYAGTEPALQELFLDCIRDIYWAENHLVKTLPKMSEAATSPKLSEAIEKHLAQTQQHVVRLEQVFDLLGEKAIAKKCDAMEGLTKEGEGIIESTGSGTATRNVGIVLASQKVEHYEIATYSGLVQLATSLGQNEVAQIFSQTLQEEQETDQLLAEIAANDLITPASQDA
jgi:ferritin-like metal-binding protein YciE